MMNQGLNPLELVLNASIIVQIVMALLLLASIVSWSIMLRKRAELRRARSDADRFEEVFWSGGDLTAMFRAIDQGRRVTKGMEAIFESGFREFQRMRQQGGFASAQLIEGARRGMRVALLKESDRLEHSLSMLATVGSPATASARPCPNGARPASGSAARPGSVKHSGRTLPRRDYPRRSGFIRSSSRCGKRRDAADQPCGGPPCPSSQRGRVMAKTSPRRVYWS